MVPANWLRALLRIDIRRNSRWNEWMSPTGSEAKRSVSRSNADWYSASIAR